MTCQLWYNGEGAHFEPGLVGNSDGDPPYSRQYVGGYLMDWADGAPLPTVDGGDPKPLQFSNFTVAGNNFYGTQFYSRPTVYLVGCTAASGSGGSGSGGSDGTGSGGSGTGSSGSGTGSSGSGGTGSSGSGGTGSSGSGGTGSSGSGTGSTGSATGSSGSGTGSGGSGSSCCANLDAQLQQVKATEASDNSGLKMELQALKQQVNSDLHVLELEIDSVKNTGNLAETNTTAKEALFTAKRGLYLLPSRQKIIE
jgi:hypothetical protein